MSSYIQINFVTYILSIIPNYVKCISLNKTEILLRAFFYFFKKQKNTLFFNLFLNFSWFAEETWAMFGIFFIEHSRLRRILTDYGFNGYLLIKDFPCVGFLKSIQKVIYDPLVLKKITN